MCLDMSYFTGMRIARAIIRPIIVVLLLLAIPVLLLVYLGLSVAAMPILIYFQLVLIEIQLEMSQRQNNLFSVQFYPFFTIEINNPLTYELKITNVSRNPAYQIFVSRVLKAGVPLAQVRWDSLVEAVVIPSLAPDESKILKPFRSMGAIDTFKKEALALELMYRDQFGDTKTLSLLLMGDSSILLLPNVDEKPGPLLRELERAVRAAKFLK